MNTNYQKPDVEKTRKPQSTVENTRRTQHVVDDLERQGLALAAVTGRNTALMHAIVEALIRFRQLDPKVKPYQETPRG